MTLHQPRLIAFVVIGCVASIFLLEETLAAKRDEYCRSAQNFEKQHSLFCYKFYGRLKPWEENQSAGAQGPIINGERLRIKARVLKLDARIRPRYLGVGRLVMKHRSLEDPEDEFVRWCTASVISNDYILTAWHCPYLHRDAVEKVYLAEAQIILNFINPSNGRGTEIFKVVRPAGGCKKHEWPDKAVCAVDGISPGEYEDGLDYAILQIGPGVREGRGAADQFGALTISTDPQPYGIPIHVPQHPRARELLLDFGVASSGEEPMPYRFLHSAYTDNMSSGSPILDGTDFKMIGIHLAAGTGGDAEYDRRNKASKIEEILKKSKVLTEIVSQQAVSIDSNPPDTDLRIKNSISITLIRSAKAQVESDTTKDFEYWNTLDELTSAAENGDARAQWELGSKFIVPQRENFRRGVLPLAGEDSFEECWDDGDVPTLRCRNSAVYWLEKSEDQRIDIDGVAQATTDLGMLFFHGIYPSETVGERCDFNTPEPCLSAQKKFARALEANYDVASTWMAVLYYYGYGVKQDIQTAANYFSKSYIAGNAEAALYLASMAERDDITYELPDEFSVKSPLSLYLEAADLGYPRAAYSLGRIYYYGTEQQKPVPNIGIAWFGAAAAEEDECAIYELEKIVEQTNPEPVAGCRP